MTAIISSTTKIPGKVRKFTSEDYAAAISILLDPYSGYYSRQAYADMISTNMGNHYGVGVSFLSREELKTSPYPGNSPAERAGIKKGGVITAVEYNEKIPVVTFEEFSEVLNAVPAETNFKMYVKYGEEGKVLRSRKRELRGKLCVLPRQRHGI